MLKRNLLTAAGIILSFAIAAGGWALTGRLIEMESASLLARTRTITVGLPEILPASIAQQEAIQVEPLALPQGAADANTTENPPAARKLSEEEIIDILRSWGAPGNETLHEPTAGQITMEQAVDAGREWLSFIDGLGFFPAKPENFKNVKAYLFQNLSEASEFLPPEYSCWKLEFTNEEIQINMSLNAVTGDAWHIEAEHRTDVTTFIDDEISNVLRAYIEELDTDIGVDIESEKLIYGLTEDIPKLPSPDNSPPVYLSVLADFGGGEGKAEVWVYGLWDGARILSASRVAMYLASNSNANTVHSFSEE